MTDIATVNTSDNAFGLGFDWAIENFSLKGDDGLTTSVYNSLFIDRVAAPDDVLPDNSGDPRGCWMDLGIDTATPDPMGSRLWLLARAKHTPQTAAEAVGYVLEALQWIKDDGVADQVTATAQWTDDQSLQLGVSIIRQVGGSKVNHRWDFVWNPSNPAIPIIVTPTILTDQNGNWIVTEGGLAISI